MQQEAWFDAEGVDHAFDEICKFVGESGTIRPFQLLFHEAVLVGVHAEAEDGVAAEDYQEDQVNCWQIYEQEPIWLCNFSETDGYYVDFWEDVCRREESYV